MACLLALLLPVGGCATVVGIVCSPVSTVVSWAEHWSARGWWDYALLPVTFPLAYVTGLLITPFVGITADVGFLVNGEYGHNDWMPFAEIFDPFQNIPGH
jgi:hypothetical protein